MVGWEFPPHNSGGLGTASLGISQGLAGLGDSIDFLLPTIPGPIPHDHVSFHAAGSSADFPILNSTPSNYGSFSSNPASLQQFGANAPERFATWYAEGAAQPAAVHAQDIIHAHDWMTYRAGQSAKETQAALGNDAPLIAHIHSTEYDRGLGSGNNTIAHLEHEGLHAADHVVAVSEHTKKIVHREYAVPLDKITVVHNGITPRVPSQLAVPTRLKKAYKLVLFLGRVTGMKGPEQFLAIAQRVAAADPAVRFMMVGSRDM